MAAEPASNKAAKFIPASSFAAIERYEPGFFSPLRRFFAASRQTIAALALARTGNRPDSAIGTLLAQTGARTLEPPMPDSLFGIHAAALELRSQRMGLIASNIANAATPGYKARDIDFAAALKAAGKGGDADKAGAAALLYRVPVMPSLDGNTVELSNEQIAFGENATNYQATLSIIRSRVETVSRALRGE
jgi:flagellar basal-body rod protein FlgB